MQTVAKSVGSGGKTLGVINFPVYDNIEEMVGKYGAEVVLKLAHRALGVDLERVARDAMKGDTPKSVKETQAIVDAYVVGGRGSKPTLKTFLALLNEFGTAGKVDIMLKGQKLYRDDSLEAGHAFLTEQKMKGALND